MPPKDEQRNDYIQLAGKVMFWFVFAVIIVLGFSLFISYLIEIFGFNVVAQKIYRPIITAIRLLHQNWIAFLPLLLVMFYRPIYKFLSNLKKIYGAEIESPQQVKEAETGKIEKD